MKTSSKITLAQRNSILFTRWPAVCRVQGWKVSDRDLRLRVIGLAVGRQITSLNVLNSTTDIDAVYARLATLSDHLARSREDGDPEPGEARRLKHIITELAEQLGWPYANAIARDKFGHARIDDLSVKHLGDWLKTLNARLHARKAKQASVPSVPSVASESDESGLPDLATATADNPF